jgi:signal transduction histidine kinase
VTHGGPRPYGRSMNGSRRVRGAIPALAAALALLALAVTAGDAWAAAVTERAWGIDAPVPALVALARLVPIGVGLLIVSRRAGAVVGWAFVVSGGAVLVLEMIRIGAVLVVERGVGGDLARMLAHAPDLFFVPVYAWPAVVVLLFPDGRLGWGARRCVAGIAVGFVLLSAGALLQDPVVLGPYAGAPNPLYTPALALPATVVFAVGWLVLLAALVGGIVVTVRRLRAAEGERRQQLRWLLPGAVLPPVSLIACLAAVAGLLPMPAVEVSVAVAQVAVCAAVFVAVTRHGLYGIDRLVNRAVVYGMLGALLLVVYAGVSATAGLLLGAGDAWVTALATAAAAVAFLPLRAWIVSLVDRRLAPRRVAAVAAIRELGARLHTGDAVPADVEPLLAGILRDPLLRVDLAGARRPGGERAEDGRIRTVVRYAGAEVAVVEHSAALVAEPDLLAASLAEAAPILAIARLQLDLRAHLRAVEESRNRVVQAGIRERRRLERDLHDGVQQRLVALGILLRRLQHGTDPRDAARDAALDAAVAQVGETIRELRALAAGVRPPRLEDGLRAALEDLAVDSPVPLEVRVSDDRLPAELETAAYFIACEAVTNAVKHARATRIVVRGAVMHGMLRVAVSDDGRGGARARAEGGGLSGMADRAGAYGGRVDVRSQDGEGTCVEVLLPCAS